MGEERGGLKREGGWRGGSGRRGGELIVSAPQ